MIEQLIKEKCKEFRLDRGIVLALITVESSGYPWAYRYENDFFTRYIKFKTKEELGGHWPITLSTNTERVGRATSFGLMQVMGQTARELGCISEALTELCLPRIGLHFGCMYLRKMLDSSTGKDDSEVYREALAKYNGGPNNPQFEYADKVLEIVG